MSEYDSSLRTGLIAINLNDGDELVRVIQTNGSDDVFMVSQQGMTIRFSEDDVRAMGRATAGVRGMRLKNENDAVVSSDVARDDAVLLFVSSSGHGKRTPVAAFNRQGRGGQGVAACVSPRPAVARSRRSRSSRATRSCCFRQRGVWYESVPTRFPSRPRTRQGTRRSGQRWGYRCRRGARRSRPRTATAHFSTRWAGSGDEPVGEA